MLRTPPQGAVFRDEFNNIRDNIFKVSQNPTNYSGAIVTFIDDDGKDTFMTWWPSILTTQGINISIACITGRVGTAGYMTLQNFKDLQTQGCEILSHTVQHIDSNTISDANADTEYKNSQLWMRQNGFIDGSDVLVYPGGLLTSHVSTKTVARKYYKYAVSTVIGESHNKLPVDNWCVPRIDGNTSTLDQLKAALDAAVLNNGWVIVMTHSHLFDAAESTKINDFIDYIQAANVPIMTFGAATEIKGNSVAIGEYTSINGAFFISHNGANKFATGLWTPVLVGSSVAGTHTYSTQYGHWTRIGNMLIAKYSINILSAGYDTAMAGNITITGLPEKSVYTGSVSRDVFEYNQLNLGANYTTVLACVNTNSDVITFIKLGNGVTTAYLAASTIPGGLDINFKGQVVYLLTL